MIGKLVGVYGSLRKGFENHAIIKNAKYLGTYQSAEKFYFILAEYPVLTPEISVSHEERKKLAEKMILSNNIYYELYELNQKEWEDVCWLEEYSGIRGKAGNLYDTVDLETEWGVAEIFVQHKVAVGEYIECGDYMKFKEIFIQKEEKKEFFCINKILLGFFSFFY